MFKQAGVQSIICIDDEFAVDHINNPPNDYFEIVEEADLKTLVGLNKIEANLPIELLPQKCKEVWSSMSQTERKALYVQLRHWGMLVVFNLSVWKDLRFS